MKYQKITLVFPGQGAQMPGMGKELHDKYKSAKDVYTRASEILRYDITKICFGDKSIVGKLKKFFMGDALNRTLYVQPAILTTSYASLRALEERCGESNISLRPYLVMGHSFGEYTALIASGATDFETALKLVQRRAELMTEALATYTNTGLMVVIIPEKTKGSEERIKNLCEENHVNIALINSPDQIVVGGPKKNLEKMTKALKGKMRTIMVGGAEGAFHTGIMESAAKKFKPYIEGSDFYISPIPIIANVTAQAIADPAHIRDELYYQVYNPVNWRDSVQKAIENGADLFIEVGPGKVLSGMLERINPKIARLNVDNLESLEKTVQELAKE